MVPSDPDSESDAPAIEPGFTEEELYVIIREAVEDAVLGVIGTLLLVGVAFVLGGGSVLVDGDGSASVALGALGIAVGFYVAASAMGVIPPIREWIT